MIHLLYISWLTATIAVHCDESNSNLFCTNELPDAQDSCDCGLSSEFTLDDINTLRNQVYEKMNNVSNPSCDTFGNDPADPSFLHPLLATLVRLAFHDCAGGITHPVEDDDDDLDDDAYAFNKVPAICDGCLNLANPDHAGLQYAVEALQDIYQDSSTEWSSKISYADFEMIATTMAVEYGHELATESTSDNSTLNEIGYFCGRPSCFSAPTTSQMFEFPNPTECLPHHVEYFHDRFLFDAADFVALIGAHKLGRLHSDNSGFSGPWARGGDELDNGYYTALKGPTVDDLALWTQKEVLGCDGNLTGRVQWEFQERFFELVMLNVDMVQERKLCPYIVDHVTGAVHANGTNNGTCEVDDNRSCPFSDDPSQEFMRLYTTSNQAWLDAFVDVWRTMIHNPYKIGKLCRIGEPAESSEEQSSEISLEVSSDVASEGFGSMFNKFNNDNENGNENENDNDNDDVKYTYTVTLSHETSMNLLWMILLLFGVACMAFTFLALKNKKAASFGNSVDEMNQNVSL